MKFHVLFSAVALSLSLSACGGKSEPAVEAEVAETASPAQTRIDAKIAAESGIRTAKIGAGAIVDEHEVQGLLVPIDGRQARIIARFPGPVRALSANVGDAVKAGQVLARIDSNLSLTTYNVTAPLSGVVLAREAAVGSVAGEGATLFEVADLSKLWVDLHVFGNDAQHIRAGSAVEVTRLSDGTVARTTLERILPGTASASQSTVARATIANDDGLWRPGSAVQARIRVSEQAAQLVVPLSAVQAMNGIEVVFVRDGENYTAHEIKLGQRDAHNAEVVSGVKAGDEVVVEQSYLVKADIEKSSIADED